MVVTLDDGSVDRRSPLVWVFQDLQRLPSSDEEYDLSNPT